jgi:predicted phosphodiesterase
MSRPLTADQALAALQEAGSLTGAGLLLGVHRSTVERALKRGGPKDTTRVCGDEADVTATDADPSDIPGLLRARKLDPDSWEVESCTVNEWDSPTGEVMRQLKLHLRRKTSVLLASPASDVRQRPRPKPKVGGASSLVVFVSDQHAPYHDPDLHKAFLSFLSHVQPDEVVLGGDQSDFPSISRHRDNPAWSADPQACIQSTFELLSDYRDAAPDARFRMLKGNHDVRLETELLNRAERMYGLRPATIDGEEAPALSLNRLLHLDRLNIELVESPLPGDGYEHAQANISPLLGARHGWLTGANTAAKTLDRLGHSVIVGHTHHQRIAHRTTWGIDRKPRVLLGVEAGCMCRLDGGLGYSINADWQQGFCTVTVWPDGTFKVDLATFVNGHLLWRDKRW